MLTLLRGLARSEAQMNAFPQPVRAPRFASFYQPRGLHMRGLAGHLIAPLPPRALLSGRQHAAGIGCRLLGLPNGFLHQDSFHAQFCVPVTGRFNRPHQSQAVAARKAWQVGREKVSYDTFFTMKRLLERSCSPEEVLRWLAQNPGKVAPSHYPVALQRLGHILQHQQQRSGISDGSNSNCQTVESAYKQLQDSPDFKALCEAVAKNCCQFDNFSVVNCLYALATLGMQGNADVVRTLEQEAHSRLAHFNQKDVSMLFSSVMKLHPTSPHNHPLVEPCLNSLERNIERERHPQTLFLLLSYYRMLTTASEPEAGESMLANTPEALENATSKVSEMSEATMGGICAQIGAASMAATGPCTSVEKGAGFAVEDGMGSAKMNGGQDEQADKRVNLERKVLRLVKHTLSHVGNVREHELVLLDEMLSTCVAQASNKSLELIFSSQLFYENRQEKFINKLAEELPKKVDSMSPHTMAIIAKYLARHRLREPKLLDTIAHFLINKAEMLDTKVLQKLVFPFSRMNYKPPSERKLMERLEAVLAQKALHSPLATVNIIMSMVQLNHFPAASLGKVFSPPFLRIIMNSPYGVIVRRYLSLLDAAITLECPSYSGPRLPDQYKVTMFDHALTADEVNRKYSYKGFVAEALRQLVGAQCFKQDEVLPPGYYTDFLLFMDDQKRLLPTDVNSNLKMHGLIHPLLPNTRSDVKHQTQMDALTADLHAFSPFQCEKITKRNFKSELHNPKLQSPHNSAYCQSTHTFLGQGGHHAHNHPVNTCNSAAASIAAVRTLAPNFSAASSLQLQHSRSSTGGRVPITDSPQAYLSPATQGRGSYPYSQQHLQINDQSQVGSVASIMGGSESSHRDPHEIGQGVLSDHSGGRVPVASVAAQSSHPCGMMQQMAAVTSDFHQDHRMPQGHIATLCSSTDGQGNVISSAYFHFYQEGMLQQSAIQADESDVYSPQESIRRFYESPFYTERFLTDTEPDTNLRAGGHLQQHLGNPARVDNDSPSSAVENAEKIHRIVMSVNDKWHYCHSSDVLVGSRAMRDRHLRLLGYHIVQLPYHDLEKLNGIEEVKKYLQRKLNELEGL
ncbi:uncharacterized protein LOC144931643 [Lampetra fluviatilis]